MADDKVKVVKPDIWTRKATPEEVVASKADAKLVVEEVTDAEFQKRQYQDFVAWSHSRGFEPEDPRNYLPTPTESQVKQEADMRLHPEKYVVSPEVKAIGDEMVEPKEELATDFSKVVLDGR